MAVAEREITRPASPGGPQPYHWTCAQFHRMGDLGLFDGQPVILIDGEILAMPPIGPEHQGTNTLAADVLRKVFGDGFFVREQAPLSVGEATDPQPDIAVIRGAVRDFLKAHPTEAVLVVEISVSTLAYDRREKAGLYARAGIADYWILNVAEAQVEVFRRPYPAADQPFGHGYAETFVRKSGESLAPLAAPDSPIAVADLLP